ncbi:PP2C family protein-serine/threonine phosphatase [Sinomonas humi]|uniref:PP2C family protein-serine/threonine phosphatase n=1 Tax=Sinomonas humi TaxID=1338436 RepID=UPI00068B9E63|nr:SpoIIE family protein phosphatase [Sinomonas humi]
MRPTETPAAEARRVEALHRLGILDTAPEERYDRFVEAACAVFGVPAAAVNFIDADRQWTKAEVGLNGLEEVPLSESMCAHTVRQDSTLVLEDASKDPRFADGMFVADGVRFYAGHPLHAPTGEPIGSLCIVDTKPRALTGKDRTALAALARLVEREVAMGAELDRAAQVQQLIMPRTAPEVPGYRLAGRCVPARSVGGDFFAWQRLPTGDLQVHVADVMGKGIPAALIAASLRAVLLGASAFNDQLITVEKVAAASQDLFGDTDTFATLFSARLNPATGDLQYIDAGHGLGFVLSPGRAPRRLASSGLPLGVVPDHAWEAHGEHLEPGDVLVVVSDGILELFPNLEDALTRAAQAKTLDAAQLVENAIAFARRQQHEDDVTILALRRDP